MRRIKMECWIPARPQCQISDFHLLDFCFANCCNWVCHFIIMVKYGDAWLCLWFVYAICIWWNDWWRDLVWLNLNFYFGDLCLCWQDIIILLGRWHDMNQCTTRYMTRYNQYTEYIIRDILTRYRSILDN